MFLKRSLFSLLHNWWKNLLLILLFSSLFAVAIGSLTLYGTTKAQTDHLQKALGNAVTLRGVGHSIRTNYGQQGGGPGGIEPEVIRKFVNAPQVASYNSAETELWVLKDAKGLYEDIFPDFKDYSLQNEYTVLAMALEDTSLHQAFNVYGFQLVEGRHITPDVMYENVCLVSRQFAEFNGLRVGDSFQVQSFREKTKPAVSVEIRGIFDPPESTYEVRGHEDTPEEMIFTSMAACYNTRTHKEEQDFSVSWRGLGIATVYLHSPEDVDVFIEEAKKKFPIRNVVESSLYVPMDQPIPEELMGPDDTASLIAASENPLYDILIDKEWYNMVGKPLEKARDLAGGIAIFLLAAILLVLALTSVLLLVGRKREIGILLSMGESKLKIMAQLAIETLVPLCIAMAVGLPLGTAVGTPLVENLCNGVYQQSADLNQKENDIAKHTSNAQDQYIANAGMPTYGYTFVMQGTGERIMVYPKAAAKLDGWSLGAYLVLVAGVSLLAVCIQAGSVVRLKPARILTGKG